ncbi:MAG: IgGFc-binding protein, partial [Bacteroidales bacterium]|nr:IgGFc-binding protein [Bacteroidales bacterium]
MEKLEKIKQGFLITLLLFCALTVQAQMETRGTDFWLAFAKNSAHDTPSGVVLQIKIVAESPAVCTVKFVEDPDYTYTINVPAHGVYTYTLNSEQRKLAYNANYSVPVSKKSIHIQSDVPVSVYALNEVNPSSGEALADATNILPTVVLGTEYYHLGRISDYADLGSRFDQCLIIATKNGTNIYRNGNVIASNLSAGQVYYTQFLPNKDHSGTQYTSNYPVAYFSAHSYCQINGGGDNFFQQLTPVNTWGKSFIVPVTYRSVELVRIVASQNNTTITQIGGTIVTKYGGKNSLTLDAGEWVELEIKLSNNGCYIQSDKPVQVCSYMVGVRYDGAINTVGGDEAICWIPPIEQRVDSVLISPFAVPNLLHHYALIVTPTKTRDNTVVSIGGTAATKLSGGTWYENRASGMSFYNVELTNSTAAYLYTNE